MVFPSERLSKSEKDTAKIAEEFSMHIQNGDIIILNGNLGSGKTFFIKRVVEIFGVGIANSPTFAIVNEYYGKKTFYHFDFYRINKSNELHDIGIEDYLSDKNAITFIEWGNLFPDVLPKERIEIFIEILDDEKRKFYFEKHE